MPRIRSNREILSNYNPLFKGVSAEKEQRERNALVLKKKSKLKDESVPAGPAGSPARGSRDAIGPQPGYPVKSTGYPVGSSTELSNPIDPAKSTESAGGAPPPEGFEDHVCDPFPLPEFLYVSDALDVIGWNGPGSKAKPSVKRLHDGFQRTFYRLTPALWKRLVVQLEEVFANAEVSEMERDDVLQKMDAVTEYAMVRGWGLG